MTYYVVLTVVIAAYLLTWTEAQKVGERCSKQMETAPIPGKCNYYFLCSIRKIWKEERCPGGREFHPKQLDCVPRKQSTCQKECNPLPIEASGSWSSPACTSGPSKQGTTCSKTCKDQFTLRGSAVIKCTEFGWNSTNGNDIPTCVDVQCYSKIMHTTLADALLPCAGMLFVMDESGSIGASDFLKSKEFVKDVVQGLPLSSSRSGGLLTFDSIPRERIALTETNTLSFQNQVDNVNYNSGGTDVLEALERALIVIKRLSSPKCYVVVLITDGNSETEATPAADAIKKLDHPLFSIAVGAPNSLSYVESLSSKGKNGVRHFFYSRNFTILTEIGKYFRTPKTVTTSTTCP